MGKLLTQVQWLIIHSTLIAICIGRHIIRNIRITHSFAYSPGQAIELVFSKEQDLGHRIDSYPC